MSSRKRPRWSWEEADAEPQASRHDEKEVQSEDDIAALAIVPPGYDPVYPFWADSDISGIPLPMPAFYNSNDFKESPVTVLSLRLQDPFQSTRQGLSLKLGSGIGVNSDGELTAGPFANLKATLPIVLNNQTTTLSLAYGNGLQLINNSLQLATTSPLGLLNNRLILSTGPGLQTANNSLTLATEDPFTINNNNLALKLAPGLQVIQGNLAVNIGPGLVVDGGRVRPEIRAQPPLYADMVNTYINLRMRTGPGLTLYNNERLEVALGNGLTTDSNYNLALKIGAGLGFNADGTLVATGGGGTTPPAPNITASAPLSIDNTNNLSLNIGAGLITTDADPALHVNVDTTKGLGLEPALHIKTGAGLAFDANGALMATGGGGGGGDPGTVTGTAPIMVDGNNNVRLELGNGLTVTNQALAINISRGMAFSSSGQLLPNLGTGMQFDNQNRIAPNLTATAPIYVDNGFQIRMRFGGGLYNYDGRLDVFKGRGLKLDTDNSLTINAGTGLSFDSNGALIATGGGSTGNASNGFLWTGANPVDNVTIGNFNRMTAYLTMYKIGKVVTCTVFNKCAYSRQEVVWTMKFLSNGRVDMNNSGMTGEFGWVAADGTGASYDYNPQGWDPTKMLPSRTIYQSSGSGQPLQFRTSTFNSYPRYTDNFVDFVAQFNTETSTTYPWSIKMTWKQPLLVPCQFCPVTFTYITE